jgi:hypothetical protein
MHAMHQQASDLKPHLLAWYCNAPLLLLLLLLLLLPWFVRRRATRVAAA